MRLWFPRERYEPDVVPRLLLAPAELVLDAMPPVKPNMRFLEVQAGAGPLARPVADRIAGLGRLVAVDLDEALARNLPRAAGRAAGAVAHPECLPFADATFDGALANTAVGGPADAGMLSELRRVLRPGGWLIATMWLAGSFSSLLESISAACDVHGLLDHAEALRAAARGLWDEASLRRAFTEADVPLVHLGVDERALFFPDVDACVRDPLVADVLLPSWLGDLPPLPAELLADGVRSRLADIPGRFAVRLRTAVVTARAVQDLARPVRPVAEGAEDHG